MLSILVQIDYGKKVDCTKYAGGGIRSKVARRLKHRRKKMLLYRRQFLLYSVKEAT